MLTCAGPFDFPLTVLGWAQVIAKQRALRGGATGGLRPWGQLAGHSGWDGITRISTAEIAVGLQSEYYVSSQLIKQGRTNNPRSLNVLILVQ